MLVCVCVCVCLSVSAIAKYLKKLSTDFDEFFGEVGRDLGTN